MILTEEQGGFDLAAARDAVKMCNINITVWAHSCAKHLPGAIDLIEQQAAEIERLRAALAESEKVVEHKGKSATHWYDEHLRAQTDLTQSKRVIEQQVARIKSLKKEIRRLKHESKVEQEFTNSYIKRLHDAEARIKELEAQCEDLMQNCNSLRERAWKAEVRIKEQDDALVEERTGAIRCESYDHCEGMYRIDLPDAMIRAQQELQAEGKIGPDAGIASSKLPLP